MADRLVKCGRDLEIDDFRTWAADGRLGRSSTAIMYRCSSVSTSFMLAALRVLHVDTSNAPARAPGSSNGHPRLECRHRGHSGCPSTGGGTGRPCRPRRRSVTLKSMTTTRPSDRSKGLG